MDQKILHAQIVEKMAATGRPIVLAMEFFQRSDGAALDRWVRGQIDDRGLLEESGWYDRGGYRWEYYRPVMEVARAILPRSAPIASRSLCARTKAVLYWQSRSRDNCSADMPFAPFAPNASAIRRRPRRG